MHCVKNATHRIRTDQGLIIVKKRSRLWCGAGDKLTAIEFTVLSSTDSRVDYGDTVIMRDGVLRVIVTLPSGVHSEKFPEWKLKSMHTQDW